MKDESDELKRLKQDSSYFSWYVLSDVCEIIGAVVAFICSFFDN